MPSFKLTGQLVPFSMNDYTEELKRGKIFIGNVNREWTTWKAVTNYKAVGKQVQAANKDKGLVDENEKFPRVEKAKAL